MKGDLAVIAEKKSSNFEVLTLQFIDGNISKSYNDYFTWVLKSKICSFL